jgi:glycosyltransferase involved in cell wall biosynthesis
MLKILLAAPVPPPNHGGIINWTRIIRREFAGTPGIDLAFVDTAVRYRAVTNKSLPLRLVGGSAQALRDTYRMRRRLKTDRPHLVHLCTSGGPATLKDIAMLRMTRAFGVPSVVHYRMGRLPSIAARGGLEWRLTRRAMALADAVITLDKRSESCAKQALPNGFVVTLPNMVEIDSIDDVRKQAALSPPLPGGPRRIVYVGHVLPAKGVRELVEACARLSGSGLLLDLVGPVGRAFESQLRAIAFRKGKADWLRFHGSVDHDQAVRHILAADLFVLPSYTEGAPNVILEAMGCGRAILGTPVGAVPEILDIGGPEECGVCVEPRDTDALATAVEQLLGDEEKRRDLGRKARQRAEKVYAVPVACAKLLDLWRSVAK